MEEVKEILIKMGFKNINTNVWESEWFGVFILLETVTSEDLAKFIYNRNRVNMFSRDEVVCKGYNNANKGEYSRRNVLSIVEDEMDCFEWLISKKLSKQI